MWRLSLFAVVVVVPLSAASVSGLVTNSVTGTPVPRAHVALDGSAWGQPGRYGAIAGADGRFSIGGLAPGTYSASAERVGFVTAPGRNRITIKENDDKNDIGIKLTPTGAISGRVTDADGEPLEGVNVVAQSQRSSESGTTDAQGQFRLGGLAPGKYRVRASRGDVFDGRPEIRTDGTAEVRYASTYYPGAIGEKEAGRVDVRAAGESTGIDVQLVRVPFVRVSGKVVGMPRGADVSVTVWQGGGGTGARTKADGSFEIWRLDPGKYKLNAEWSTPSGDSVQTAGVEIEVAGSNIDGIELRVIADSNISGRLEYDDDRVKRAAAQEGGERVVTLTTTGPQADVGISAKVGDDDTFRLDKVPAGKYRVGLSWNAAYVKSARLGTTVVEGAELDLSNGSGGADLALLLSESNGSISGTVRGESGALNAMVALIANEESPGFQRLRHVSVQAGGTYNFSGLAPGSYRIAAMETDDPALAGEYLFGDEDLSESVEVGAGEVTKDLKVRPLTDQ